jgi:hypothetical protein
MKKNLIVLSLAMALSVPALANTKENIGWDAFVEQCSNPKGKQDKQFLPEDIQIQCEVVTHEWKEQQAKVFELETYKEVRANIISKKQAVATLPESRSIAPATSDCSVHQKFEKVERFSLPVSCDTILAIAQQGKSKGDGKKGSPHDYCENTGKGKDSKEKSVEYRAVGVALNACPAGVKFVEGKDKGGKDKPKDEEHL